MKGRIVHAIWEEGSVIRADGMLYGEKGRMGLIRIKPDGCELPAPSPSPGAHPAISNGRPYIRHGEALMCYDIRAM